MICKTCGETFNGPKRSHECDMILLTNGVQVRASRVDNPDGDIRKKIEAGEVKIEARLKQKVNRLFER